MLDINVMTDYGKIRRQFQIDNGEEKRIALLEELLQNGEISIKKNKSIFLCCGFYR